MRIGTMAAGALALALAVPGRAQDDPRPASGSTAFDGDYLSVALGAAYGPSYDGSDDMVVFPAALVQGSLGGIDFTSRGAGVARDFIPDPAKGGGFDLGVSGQLRGNRAR